MNVATLPIIKQQQIIGMRCDAVRFVAELYPRLKPNDEIIERYRSAIGNLPPIVVARDGILVDGFHRWQAHVREEQETVEAIDLGNLADAEILRESIKRNASHGHQLSQGDKKKLADAFWMKLGHMPAAERITDLAALFSVDERTVQRWTQDARKSEKEEQQASAWDMWLDCESIRAIAEKIGGPDEDTIGRWLSAKTTDVGNADAPLSRQHFDIWQFQTADKDSGQQSYFGAVPPQVIENLLWFYTEPGDIVVDVFSGSGTTVDVAKAMGRRVWASDIRGNHYSPHLPIHQHDVTAGWPENAPKKADLTFLDPPYWKQAAGRYSDEPNELAEMDLPAFMAAWNSVVDAAMAHSKRVAFIISPTQESDGSVIDHATAMLPAFLDRGWHIERRIIVPYSTQQATGQQVTWARDNKRMLKLYRDLVVLSK